VYFVDPWHWLELLAETGTAGSVDLEPLQKECHELLAIFTTIAKKCKAIGKV
jgi:hypothetical protein